jgi:uncharacterized membrane protein YidH (DUF202 family)
MTQLVQRRFGRVTAAVRAVPGVGIWIGVTLCALGMLLIVVAWGSTADTTDVALQVPYVVSAGLTGLGLVVVGVAVAFVVAQRRDAEARAEQVRELTATLAEIRSLLEGRR